MTYWYLTGLLAALGFSFGFYLVKPAGGAANHDRDFLEAFNWMDGKWYKQIATAGYDYDPDARSNVAFFPVYPLLARGLIAATGIRAEVALLIVSNVSLLAALAMLMLYVRARWPDAPSDLAECIVLAAALFPTGCFFRLAYSESTCLLLTVLAMYAMLRRWPLWSIALSVGLATAARPVGVALLAPFAIHIFRRGCHRHQSEAPARSGCPSAATEIGATEQPERSGDATAARKTPGARGPRWRFGFACVRLALYLPLACWGLINFMAYQHHAFN
ncbi:MAG: hypothetical protein ACRD27_04355, partial [Terracidiphilus sp.]